VLPESAPAVIRDCISALDRSDCDAPYPEQFPLTTQLAIRQYLADSGCGGEVIVTNIDDCPSLRIASTVTLTDMDLSVRSYNCLHAASIETLDQLLTWTPARLMALPNFGAKCMTEIDDLVRQLGYALSGTAFSPITVQRHLPLSTADVPLATLLTVGELVPQGGLSEAFAAHGWHCVSDFAIHSTDSLISLAELDRARSLLLETSLRALGLEIPMEVPPWVTQNIAPLRVAFKTQLSALTRSLYEEAAPDLLPALRFQLARSLNEEIWNLVPSKYSPQKREIVSLFLGLGGQDPMTLDGVAKTVTPSLTRERVRQITAPVMTSLTEKGKELPWLARAIEALQAVTPCSIGEAEEALLQKQIVNLPLTVSAILSLARRAFVDHDLCIESEALLTEANRQQIEELVRVSAKMSSRWGAADWQELELLIPNIREPDLRQIVPGVVWLDAGRRYFVFPARENSLANRLARILTVTPRLGVSEAYDGAFRDPKMDRARLPQSLFSAFCRVWPWCEVREDTVVAGHELLPSQASGDDLLVLLLREIGRPVRRRELLSRALKQGISEATVAYSLTYSNVIVGRHGHFGVVGDPLLNELTDDMPDELDNLTVEERPFHLIEDEQAGGFVPRNTDSQQYVETLMLAVQRRIGELGLKSLWSAAELRLSHQDRERLLQWGGQADWNFRDDYGNYRTRNGESTRKRTALGLAFLLFAMEAARKFAGAGSIWPAIEKALGPSQQELFLVRAGIPKSALREAVESACRTFGLRHGFEDISQQVWVRTVGLQYGLQCTNLSQLSDILGGRPYPIAVQLLLEPAGVNASPSFQAAWNLLIDARRGALSEQSALEQFAGDPWLSPFAPAELWESCLKSTSDFSGSDRSSSELGSEPYRYFESPRLRWEPGNAYLEYSLNAAAPAWADAASLVIFCDSPYRKERIPIEAGAWRLPGGPIRLPLTLRDETSVLFKLMQGKDVVYSGTIDGILDENRPFVFFRESGAMVVSSEEPPVGEELFLLHLTELRLVGVDSAPEYLLVLRGNARLTRLPVSTPHSIRLVDPDNVELWTRAAQAAPLISLPVLTAEISGVKWGLRAEVTLPQLAFIPDRLRLHNGDILLIENREDLCTVEMTPALGRADTARVQGRAGVYRRSVLVKLVHRGVDFGAAAELSGKWVPLDGSLSIDAGVLRTCRMLAKSRITVLGSHEELCWMEGCRTLAGLRNHGTSLMGVHGLGEPLSLTRGTYNQAETEIRAARTITDHGFLRSVRQVDTGLWTATLPFETPLEQAHRLWVWSTDADTPVEVERSLLTQKGFTLQWRSPTRARVFGWAFSFAGTRVGSICLPETLGEFAQFIGRTNWHLIARWLRWWHVPVLDTELRTAVALCVRTHPVETLRHWLLPVATDEKSLIFDELHDESWAAAAREFLWDWQPRSEQAVHLITSMKIWTGNIEEDVSFPPSPATFGLLARVSPVLLVRVISRGLPTMHEFSKPQLAVLVGMLLESVDANAVNRQFRLEDLCERYAQGESRLDGRFILTRIVGAARELMLGNNPGLHNLQIAFHQPGLREIVTIALLSDLRENWINGRDI